MARTMERRSGRCVCAVLFVFMMSTARAGVNVYPTELFVNPPNRSAPLVLINGTDKETEVWITFRFDYPVSFENSRITFHNADSLNPEPENAVPWIKAIPQRLVLAARESRSVRIFATPPAGAESGEFWARIVINQKDTKKIVPSTGPKMTIGMDLVTQTVVPFHFRRGLTTSGVLVKQAKAAVNGNALRLQLDLERTGNAAFWGRLVCELIDQRGRSVQEKEFKLVVYKDFTYAALMDIGKVKPGSYTVRMTIDNRHPSVSSKDRIRSEPIVQSAPIAVP